MLLSMLVLLRLSFWVVSRFLTKSCFLLQFSCFLRWILLLLTFLHGTACTACKWCGVCSHGWCGGVLGSVREVKRACYLAYQPDSWFWIPVRLLVIQGNWESRSAYHTWVRYRNRDWNLTVYPHSYVCNEFVHFRFYSLTQLRKCNQGFPL